MAMTFYLKLSQNCFRKSFLIKKTSNLFKMSSPRDLCTRVKEVEEELNKNPFFDKYAAKIAAVQQTTPEEFVARYEASKPNKCTLKEKTKEQVVGSAKVPLSETPVNVKRQLSKIMKTELLDDKSAVEIKKIWEEYFKGKDAIAAAVPAALHSIIEERSAKYPLFLFPLPRSQGYEFFLLQFSDGQVHFTPLISYQTHGENAPECLLITYYDEFKIDKGIVLMHGEFDINFLNAIEAQCLANQLQLYYGEKDTNRTKLLDKFTLKPNSFDHMDLVTEVERLSF